MKAQINRTQAPTNGDEKLFIDLFRFDVKRSNAQEHLGFGIGVHFCPDANLARMELKSFFRELLPRFESIELTGADVVYSSRK